MNTDRRSLLKLAGLSLAGLGATSLSPAAARLPASAPPAVLRTPTAAQPLLLNFNENSIGMAPAARAAIIDTLDRAFRYPDDPRAALIDALAAGFGVDAKQLSLGNGSSENIQALIQALVQRARAASKAVQLVVPDPTFNYAELYAKALDMPIVKVPLTGDMHFDLPALQAAARDFDGHTVFYLCNPNNPTATITPAAQLDAWIKAAPAGQFFILDEAYAEFVSDPAFVSGIDWIKAGRSNLAVTRTFSKLYALAGLRVGYAIADAETINACEAFMALDNTNLAGAVAALASLRDSDFQQRSRASIDRARQIVIATLDELGLRHVPSHANFIFHEVGGEVKTYQERMKAEHIIVGREFPPAVGWSRLTLGTPEEMTIFAAALRSFRTRGWV